ncbi:lysine--tRNA ligase [Thermodesulfobacterium sp. TA1]|uniref:lysine--tRNA ligase n=1 Tax=Thermodesulfobacterium sp. TA1 TaxID=2234087 RepID=UPI0012328F73|nr:lysine--tRNA ligase [Thermodesulfobacterium sp. TA1]QER42387.1 lysine--tRNA ligase [Thermodesulfobacterium sp. TA1]
MLEESQVIKVRFEKLEKLESMGIKAYPNDFRPKDKAKYIKEIYEGLSPEEIEKKTQEFVVAGRIMARREMGKLVFAHLQDDTDKIQILIAKNELPQEDFEFFKKFIDIGDIIGVRGRILKTKTGEITILVKNFKLLTKALRPLPEKYHGLKDTELRYRMRYVDLIMNPKVREIFRTRTQVIHYIRDYFISQGFLEVETPMMHPIAGGAAAKPFITYHNALDMNLYLRIAPELYLKRLVVGGFNKVFELNRNFRNEGVSSRHNPEFTMLEFYEAYATYEDLMKRTEELFYGLALDIKGSSKIVYQGQEIDFTPPWQRIEFLKSLIELGGVPEEVLFDREKLIKFAKEKGIELNLKDPRIGKWWTKLFEELVEPKLIQPTFVVKFPVEVSPLARRSDENPDFAERFELYIAGKEVANAFSELNDPRDQRKRFEEQLKLKDIDEEIPPEIDEDFIRALEYGMPPCAGEGIGIDRVVMLFTDSPSIREVILFPHLRRKEDL